MLENIFKLNENKTSVKTEMLAGLATFLTMAYIIVVNPAILSTEGTGMDFGGVFVATIIAAVVGCLVMGLLANWPIALAPGMGLNAFFAFGVVFGMGYTYQQALAAVFIAGLAFLLLSVTPARQWIINSIPKSMKFGVGAGIGLFLAIIGLQNAGIVVDNPATLVGLGDVSSMPVMLSAVGFAIMAILDKRGIPGAIIIGILAVSLIAWITGVSAIDGVVGSVPPAVHAFSMDFSLIATAGFIGVAFAFLFVDFFDTAGTLTSVANVAGKIGKDGKVKDINKAMLSDSVSTVAGAMMGTSTVTSYVESGAGVKAGGKTGMTSLVIVLLFLACIFFAPLATSLPKQIDGAALLFVSVLFIRNITDIEWNDISESAPAILAMITMPLTYSISNGIALAFVSYALIKICTGKFSKTSPAIWVIAILSVISFVVA